MSTTIKLVILFVCVLMFHACNVTCVDASLVTGRKTIFHTLNKVYEVDYSVNPAFTLENGAFRVVMEMHWSRSNIYEMFGTYTINPEGAKCASAPSQVILKNVAHAKLMCVEVSMKVRADAGSVPIPIHIFPELDVNIDPTSVAIYQTMQHDKFEKTVEPSQGPWGLEHTLFPSDPVNSVNSLTSFAISFYSKVNVKQQLGQQFTVSFAQKVTFSDQPNLELIIPNVESSQAFTVTSSNTIKNVGDFMVLNQFTIQEVPNLNQPDYSPLTIVKFSFPQVPPNISPESIKCFVAVANSPTYQVEDSTITTELDGHTVLSCTLSDVDLHFDLLIAGKQVPQHTVPQDQTAITPGTEYIFKNVLSNGNFQNSRITLSGGNDLRGNLKVTSCLATDNYRNAKITIPGRRTRLSLESITTLEMNNVVGGANGIANIYIERVLEKRNVDPISARVLLYNRRTDEFKPPVSHIEINQE